MDFLNENLRTAYLNMQKGAKESRFAFGELRLQACVVSGGPGLSTLRVKGLERKLSKKPNKRSKVLTKREYRL